MNKRPYRTRLSAFSVALLLAGCALGPDYRRPELDLPQDWRTPPASDAATARKADSSGERWWSLYADPVLDRLIAEALSHNAEAAIAAARVLEARAIAGLADADLYPSLSASFAGNRTRSTLDGSFPRPADLPRTQNSFRATLDASYEIDLWGRYRRASEAARSDLLAAESARESVRLSLTAQVAQQYFALLAADAQLAVAQRTLASRSETLALFGKRVDAGTLSEYGLHQAEAEQAATRSQLAGLRQAQDRLESALALQLGRSPRAVMSGGVERGAPQALSDLVVPAGLPSDLLLRRPDLREAEARLVAANARIGSARAQYFPSIALTAYLGGESVAFSRLFSGPSRNLPVCHCAHPAAVECRPHSRRRRNFGSPPRSGPRRVPASRSQRFQGRARHAGGTECRTRNPGRRKRARGSAGQSAQTGATAL